VTVAGARLIRLCPRPELVTLGVGPPNPVPLALFATWTGPSVPVTEVSGPSTPAGVMPDDEPPLAPCWELGVGARFCASLANGRTRCKKGTCSLLDPLPNGEESKADGPSGRQVGG